MKKVELYTWQFHLTVALIRRYRGGFWSGQWKTLVRLSEVCSLGGHSIFFFFATLPQEPHFPITKHLPCPVQDLCWRINQPTTNLMSDPSNLHNVSSPENLQELLGADLSRVSVLYFRADWAEPCTQMDAVLIELAKRWPGVLFLSIEAESLPDISESFEVDAVPYFILLRGHTLLTRLSGAQPSVLSAALTSHASKPTALSSTNQKPVAANSTYNAAESEKFMEEDDDEGEGETDEELVQRCNDLMNQSDIVLFMKGDRTVPRCGFSQKIIGILEKEKVEYSTFDILSDEGVRQKLKELNTWPTFPQLIIKGEFVGGLDVVNEMVENGEFKEMLA